jgi:peptidoglycan/xylan/chitin deacetylase (PgdA/CDA1 family)
MSTGTFSWPGGCQGAISLTFDDGVWSQPVNAIPVLDRYGVRGTFYVTYTRPEFEQSLDAWRGAFARGHEIANHSRRHPCSGNFPWVGENALEEYTLEQMAQELREAQEDLRRLVPGLDRCTFAYPCGQTFVGRGRGRQSYVPLVAEQFPAGRGVGESANRPQRCDLACLSSWMVSGETAAQLIARAEGAVEAGDWGIFCFHGIGQAHFNIEVEAFEGLVRHLAENKDRIRTDTVLALADHVAGPPMSRDSP